ncbi:MAG: tyrosine--tRNA ligase [Victivallales bacterium]|nr:tyrosine--tRNA ligase [Victivallales bacterium]
MDIYDDFKNRGLVYQSTDEVRLSMMLSGGGGVSFYAGFDPTGNSLHVGHLLPVMAMRRLQCAGHCPIVLVGGATALVGDPSGKQDARPILSREEVAANAAALKSQLAKFISVESGKAVFVDNAEWFSSMGLLDFLRETASRFSVSRMLAAESVKQRLDTGLSYLEFSYMLLQAYDYYHLNKHHGCVLQIGGQDQWGNIVAGVELVRKLSGSEVAALTFPLLTDSSGAKFGKTAAGAVWLDPSRTSVFDYYQFWRNCDDSETGRLLRLFTDLPLDEIASIEGLEPPRINRAKEILAYEATALAHGHAEATKVYLAAGSKFGFADSKGEIETSSAVAKVDIGKESPEDLPGHDVCREELQPEGKWIVQILSDSGLTSSNSEARRLILGGGVSLDGKRISDVNRKIKTNDFNNGYAILKAGKKHLRRLHLV